MRLLRVADQVVVEVREDEIPRYVSLSHTWGEGEVSFQEMERLAPLRDTPLNEEFEAWSARIDKCHAVQGKTGFKKIEQAANLARQLGYEYVWIDTCCIDKTSSVELSEAINSMYRWYAESDLCCAYLADVPPLDHKSHWDSDSAFRRSRWFTRGWTLQELIAPAQVSFFAKDWSKIDEKSNPRFCRLLADITGIDESVLNASRSPHNVSVASRMSWAASRQATRTEDIAYCLMGIFQVNMPLLYGEGHRAFLRLQEEILKEVDDQSLFAWDEPATESIRILGSEITLHGLLAASPALFSKKYQLLPLPPMELRDSTPLQITSQGLRASFYLLPARQGNREDYSAVLDCSLRIPGSHQLYSPVQLLLRMLSTL
ncbi:HET-domain-containing protein [Thozetella sp. PMI_491]|nr:HET-domain-containing protein [Thozetella sp. PMI_491]